MASIQVYDNQTQTYYHICGGSIIEKNQVLTAAHCLHNRHSSNLRVVFGCANLKNESPYKIIKEVAKLVIHSSYVHGKSYNDVAIIVLESELDFNDAIGKICLPKKSTPDSNHLNDRSATLTGWGSIQEKGPASTTLRQASLTILSQNFCNDSRLQTDENGISSSKSSIVPRLFTSEVMCAGTIHTS